tara:strand:+ start:65 stop:853 length:789 start_codon:yes stop_codon:yes gene_type:complete
MKTLRILSLGAGVQSTTLALMHHFGEIEPFDHIIFADTGWEPGAVYDHLQHLSELMEITTVSAGDVRSFVPTFRADGQTRFASIPLWFEGKNGKINILRRQCTREYKIEPIEKHIKREIMGLEYRQRWPVKEVLLEVNLGISTDELGRVSQDSRKKWKINRFPLIEMGMSRDDCSEYLTAKGYAPIRSACIGCPYRSNEEWKQIKSVPEEWKSAIEFDEMVRHVLPDATTFLHRTGVPLAEVDLGGENNSSLLDECSGMCAN